RPKTARATRHSMRVKPSLKALPLEGGGLGGGEDRALTAEGRRRSVSCALSRKVAATPPSPTLPPSRGKGETVLFMDRHLARPVDGDRDGLALALQPNARGVGA